MPSLIQAYLDASLLTAFQFSFYLDKSALIKKQLFYYGKDDLNTKHIRFFKITDHSVVI